MLQAAACGASQAMKAADSGFNSPRGPCPGPEAGHCQTPCPGSLTEATPSWDEGLLHISLRLASWMRPPPCQANWAHSCCHVMEACMPCGLQRDTSIHVQRRHRNAVCAEADAPECNDSVSQPAMAHLQTLLRELWVPAGPDTADTPVFSSCTNSLTDAVMSLPDVLRARSAQLVGSLELGAALGRGSYGTVYKGALQAVWVDNQVFVLP